MQSASYAARLFGNTFLNFLSNFSLEESGGNWVLCLWQHHISKMGYFKCTILFNICTISFLSYFVINILTNCLLQGWNLTQSWGKCSETIWQHSSAKSFSQAKYSTQFCLFVLTNQIFIQASKTQIFGYLWHLLLFSNVFFKTKMWQKAEEYIPK